MKWDKEKHRKVILVFLVGCLILVYILFAVNFGRFHPIPINELGECASEIWMNLCFTFPGGILLYLIGIFMPEKREFLRKICKIYGIITICAGVLMGIITAAELLF